MRVASEAFEGLLDLLYPPRCLVCGAMHAESFCAACRETVRPILPPFCDRCGAPVAADAMVCPACLEGPEPPYAWTHALGRYEGPLRLAIHRLKFDGKTALARPLGRMLAASLTAPSPLYPANAQKFDAVVPVPLHWRRRRIRGFNQAELIARAVAEIQGWTLDTRNLTRNRYTRPQTTQSSREERADNLIGAFTAHRPLAFYGKSVLLIDDVLTTTATCRAAAHALREAGAVRVAVATVARSL